MMKLKREAARGREPVWEADLPSKKRCAVGPMCVPPLPLIHALKPRRCDGVSGCVLGGDWHEGGAPMSGIGALKRVLRTWRRVPAFSPSLPLPSRPPPLLL